jgi:serine/threonine-protein kinase HipA
VMVQAHKAQVEVCVGPLATHVGRLSYVKAGAREYSSFAYDPAWLSSADSFEISPDLPLQEGPQNQRAQTAAQSCFHHALADTEPDAWGRRIINRAHAKARKANPHLPALNAFDYLCAVDDFSRVGALRLRAPGGGFLSTPAVGQTATPALLELQHMLAASRAVERNLETASDLKYLQGKGTSLGGMRPKCTVLEEDGSLALGKFPSVADERCVTRAEVLALHLARRCGVEAAASRVVVVGGAAVAVVRRFDRTASGARIPYLSAASMLLATRDEERAYTEVVDRIRACCVDPVADARQLWRRLVFNHLITNVDDHLQNLGFLYVGRGQWRLAPAFDVNPFPDKDRESKTWLSEDSGPVDSVALLLAKADYFHLSRAQALMILRDVVAAVHGWRVLATSPVVGLTSAELEDFAPAFEHPSMLAARALLA